MAQKTINVGAAPSDGSGDSFRIAGTTINANFSELYALPPVTSHIGMADNNIISTLSNADIDLNPSGTGSVVLGSGIRINDNNIEAIRTNDDIKVIPSGSGGVNISGIKVSSNNIYSTRSNDDIVFSPSGTGNVVLGAVKVDGTTLSSEDSSTININEDLFVDGLIIVQGTATFGSATSLTYDTVPGQFALAVTGVTTLSSNLNVTGATTLTTTAINQTSRAFTKTV